VSSADQSFFTDNFVAVQRQAIRAIVRPSLDGQFGNWLPAIIDASVIVITPVVFPVIAFAPPSSVLAASHALRRDHRDRD
jgi:hypothetical protein